MWRVNKLDFLGIDYLKCNLIFIVYRIIVNLWVMISGKFILMFRKDNIVL